MRSFFDIKFLKFVAVGILNTIVGTAIMFISYNVLHLGYVLSVSANYVLTSIMSFFLNKYFTFKSHGDIKKEVVKFAVNIALCAIAAYGIAKPLVVYVLSKLGDGFYAALAKIPLSIFAERESVETNIALLVGMVLFVAFNYAGQRFFAFKHEE